MQHRVRISLAIVAVGAMLAAVAVAHSGVTIPPAWCDPGARCSAGVSK